MTLFSLFLRRVVLVAFATAWLVACDPEPLLSDASFRPVIGGQATEYQSYRSVVAVRVDGGLCTGTLIHPRVVLTAAHCVKQNWPPQSFDYTGTPEAIEITGGANVLAPGAIFYATATAVLVHPSWTGVPIGNGVDLALIGLESEIATLARVPVLGPPAPKAGDAAVVAGYGEDGGDSFDDGLGVHRAGQTTLKSVTARLLSLAAVAHACGGDSGGPVLVERDGVLAVAGVTSFSMSSTCLPGGTSYAVNVQGFCPWLRSAFASLAEEPLPAFECDEPKDTQSSEADTTSDPATSGDPATASDPATDSDTETESKSAEEEPEVEPDSDISTSMPPLSRCSATPRPFAAPLVSCLAALLR